MLILSTPRLLLREFEVSDAKNLFDLNSDPDVTKYTGDGPFKNIEEATNFIRNYKSYKNFGYGRWAVIEKTTAEFLGWCGLKYEEELNATDIGYRFHKRYWGKGYAGESAIACIGYGFQNLNLERIVGRSMKLNIGSIKVLEKCKMTFLKEMEFALHEGILYEITRENYFSLKGSKSGKFF